VTRQGALASYSNFGSQVAVSAPGGDKEFNDPLDEITTTWDSGTTVPLNDNNYTTDPTVRNPSFWAVGTSEAAAHVRHRVSDAFGPAETAC